MTALLQQLDPTAVRILLAAGLVLIIAILGCAAFDAAERQDGRAPR